MTFIEKALLCTLYAMYLHECVYWVTPAEQAFTRLSATAWRTWSRQPLGFTLLGRTPVLVSPLLLRPGFIRRPQPLADAPGVASATARTLTAVGHRLDNLPMLLTLCRLEALLLLVYLPALMLLHRLARLGLFFACLLLGVHVAVSLLAIRALRRARPSAWITPGLSLALNPIGATRALDLLAPAFFDRAQTRPQRPARRRLPNSRKA